MKPRGKASGLRRIGIGFAIVAVMFILGAAGAVIFLHVQHATNPASESLLAIPHPVPSASIRSEIATSQTIGVNPVSSAAASPATVLAPVTTPRQGERPQSVLTIPKHRVATVKQPGVLKLPSVFKGCWQLVSDRQAGPVRILPGAPAGCLYTQDSGRFCYQRVAGGDYEPTFSSLRLKPGLYGVQNDEWSRVDLLSTDGVDSMKMRFLLHHDQSAQVIPFLFAARSTIDETHELNCTVHGDMMRCRDREFGRLSGVPWCIAIHNDEFHKVAAARPPRSRAATE